MFACFENINCFQNISPEVQLDKVMKVILSNIDTVSITKCNTMKYYKIMKNTDCNSYLLITYMEEIMSQQHGRCVVSIHVQNGAHVDETQYIGLDGQYRTGTVFDFTTWRHRKELTKKIITFIK